MNTDTNLQLQFFIKLTQIIGRAFTDIQQLLTSELRRQQSDIQIRSIIVQTQPYHQPINYPPPSQPSLISQSNSVKQDEKKQSSEEEQDNKKQVFEKQDRRRKRRSKIHKLPKPKKIAQVLKQKKKRTRRSAKQIHEEGKPSPPLNAFMLFLQEKKSDIMNKKPELSPSQVSIHASTIWKGYNQSEKQHYLQIYKKNHQIYLQKLKVYKNKQKIPSMCQEKNEEKSPIIGKQCQNQNRLIENLRSKTRKTIKRRKNARNQVICIESEEQNQNQP